MEEVFLYRIEKKKLLKIVFFPHEDLDVQFPHMIRLFGTNNEVQKYNRKKLNAIGDCIENIADDKYIGPHSKKILTDVRNRVHKLKITKTSGLPYTFTLANDTPYMITLNINVADGLVNGAVGKLKYVEYSDKKEIMRLWLEFEDKQLGAMTECRYAKFCEEHPEIKPSYVPILKRTAHINFKYTSLYCRRTQFPLFKASALAVHKSQGSTFLEVIYEYPCTHDRAKAYVALVQEIKQKT